MKIWCYADSRNKQFQTTESDLENLVECGTITAKTRVWTNGMENWIPAQEAMPNLFLTKFPTSPDTVLLEFEPSGTGGYREYRHSRVPWTLRDAFCGTQIFGMTGSGKTSGSGQEISRAFLRNGFGGLVMCHKIEEVEDWKKLCQRMGRLSDLIVFPSETKQRFNFLDYESKAEGGSTENLYRLFAVLAEVGERSIGGSASDPFWKNALKELIINSIELLKIAREPVTLPNIERVISTSPSSAAEVDDDKWKSDSFCFQLLDKSWKQKKTPKEDTDFRQTASYWLRSLPNLAEKTRSCVFSMFSGTAVSLMRGDLRQIFCEGTSDIDPKDTLRGKIIVLNLPIKKYYEEGRYAQILFKYIWQRVMERRDTLEEGSERGRPQFLWADESHNFFVSHDMDFQTTSRSAKVASVYLTQNIENYRAVLPEVNREAIMGSFLGNLKTKIFHANEDVSTNEYASEQLGKRVFIDEQSSQQYELMKVIAASRTESQVRRYDYQVTPIEFKLLKCGGLKSNRQVEAFVSGSSELSNFWDGIAASLKKKTGLLDEDLGFIRAKFYQNGE